MKEQATRLMQAYFAPEEAQVQHALKVTGFAERIFAGEGLHQDFIQQVIVLSGIFHDVGIPEALRLHGTAAGPYQEEAGEPIARRLLTDLSTRADIRERVCFIVRHHHSQEFVDGVDFQIILEADALVNIPNRHAHGRLTQPLSELIEQIFVTRTGREIITSWGNEQGLV